MDEWCSFWFMFCLVLSGTTFNKAAVIDWKKWECDWGDETADIFLLVFFCLYIRHPVVRGASSSHLSPSSLSPSLKMWSTPWGQLHKEEWETWREKPWGRATRTAWLLPPKTLHVLWWERREEMKWWWKLGDDFPGQTGRKQLRKEGRMWRKGVQKAERLG